MTTMFRSPRAAEIEPETPPVAMGQHAIEMAPGVPANDSTETFRPSFLLVAT